MHTPPFTASTLLDRAAALMAAGLITLSVLLSLGDIADHQVDAALMAQAATTARTA